MIAVLGSCKRNLSTGDNNILSYQYSYFPTTVGHWVMYEVDSVTYDDFYVPPLVDTADYYVKEVIEEQITDDAGDEAFILVKYRSPNSNGPWRVFGRDIIKLLPSRAERVEDNMRFIKLVFPSYNNQKWSGNNYLETTSEELEFFDNWEYQYQELYATSSVGDFVFDSVMTVMQKDVENLLEKVYFEEKYVKKIGLVYKKRLSVGKQNIDEDWNEGFELTYKIIDYKDE